MAQRIPDPISDVTATFRTNCVGIASFTILIWDHIDTFADEVEYIWKGNKGPIVYLFLLNRYFTPLGFMINLFAYFSPTWTPERFIICFGCTVAIAVEVVGLMMSLRINALYPHQKWIPCTLWALLLIETGVNIWLISGAEAVVHSQLSGVHACTMIFNPAISGAASASAWFPLLYDSIVFGLTIYRTVPSIRRREAGYILKRLLEDGLLYYSVIFTVTLILTIMIAGAPPGVKNIAAQLEQLMTVAMMSRITLNLRKAGRYTKTDILTTPKSFLFDRRRRRPSSDVFPRILTVSRTNHPCEPKPVLASDLGTDLKFAGSEGRHDYENYEMQSSRESQPKPGLSTSNQFQPPESW